MIDRVSPAGRPSNQELHERRRALLRHPTSRSSAVREGPSARQQTDDRRRDVIASHTSEGRQTKIAQLQRAVASGTYHTNGEQLAQKIISETLVDILA
jgi:anti-sigma28 factor (negative regulator of flagellin synthesis)